MKNKQRNDKENFKKFLEIIRKIENSPGYKINIKMRELEISFKVMVFNFIRLKQCLLEVPIFSTDEKEKSEQFQIESLRLFVNFLNSTRAFIDHTRNHIKFLYENQKKTFKNKYQAQINNEFRNNAMAQFIEDLRNFYDHYNILPVGIVMRANDQQKLYAKIFLSKQLLLKSDYKWKKGNEFLIKCNEHIDILEVCEKYLFKTLFVWLMNEESKLYKSEFKKLNQLKHKAKKLLKEK